MSDTGKTGDAGREQVKFTTQIDCENDDCHEKRAQRAAASGNAASAERPVNMEECMGRSMEQLSTAFMASAKRWEMIVYPSLFAFIVLAGYGFFLIYSLATNVTRIADSMSSMTENMQQVSMNMNKVTQNMVLMTQTVDSQSATMHEIVVHMQGMNHSMAGMRYDISVMNNSVLRPMSFMNSFMPW